jgi:hypothetical protein
VISESNERSELERSKESRGWHELIKLWVISTYGWRQSSSTFTAPSLAFTSWTAFGGEKDLVSNSMTRIGPLLSMFHSYFELFVRRHSIICRSSHVTGMRNTLGMRAPVFSSGACVINQGLLAGTRKLTGWLAVNLTHRMIPT